MLGKNYNHLKCVYIDKLDPKGIGKLDPKGTGKLNPNRAANDLAIKATNIASFVSLLTSSESPTFHGKTEHQVFVCQDNMFTFFSFANSFRKRGRHSEKKIQSNIVLIKKLF